MVKFLFFSTAADTASTLLPIPPVVLPSAQKWVPVRSQNGTASLQDFVVSVDAATPAYAKSSATAAPPAGAAAPTPAAAAAAALAAGKQHNIVIFSMISRN